MALAGILLCSSSCLSLHSKNGVFVSNPCNHSLFPRNLSTKNTQFLRIKEHSLKRPSSSGKGHFFLSPSSSSTLIVCVCDSFCCNFTGLPTELIEESKFVPLNADDPRFGPPALLLLGFELEDAVKIKQLLKELDGEFLEIIFCTEDMISRPLWEAVNTQQPNFKALKIAKPLPRICFMSGLTGEEMMMFIDAFSSTGLEESVFAAVVPNAADKPVEELIEEIMGDHQMLSTRHTSQVQSQAFAAD
ncbi:hypothetical protein DM860_009231 [Cuscuta australis]|uniref:Uncharacterized protein n=1 Tax=Cuscuta australis TaxID=267555 RepID=A0A328DB71_9ASTE|nr:hypothetical protein DM860_009231 [Cuscuta australis]